MTNHAAFNQGSGLPRRIKAGFAAAVRGAGPHSATAGDVARLIALIDRVKASARANCAEAIDPAP